MNQKSKLSDKQWHEVEQRLLAGESGRSIAAIYKVSEALIRKRMSARTKSVKTVANQLATAEVAFKQLPIGAQISARSLADKLVAISMDLASAAEHGAATALGLKMMARAQMQRVDAADPMKSHDVLQGIAILTKMANGSAEIGLSLMAACKEKSQSGPEENTITIHGGLPDD